MGLVLKITMIAKNNKANNQNFWRQMKRITPPSLTPSSTAPSEDRAYSLLLRSTVHTPALRSFRGPAALRLSAPSETRPYACSLLLQRPSRAPALRSFRDPSILQLSAPSEAQPHSGSLSTLFISFVMSLLLPSPNLFLSSCQAASN